MVLLLLLPLTVKRIIFLCRRVLSFYDDDLHKRKADEDENARRKNINKNKKNVVLIEISAPAQTDCAVLCMLNVIRARNAYLYCVWLFLCSISFVSISSYRSSIVCVRSDIYVVTLKLSMR